MMLLRKGIELQHIIKRHVLKLFNTFNMVEVKSKTTNKS